jgi:hypothetical protein
MPHYKTTIIPQHPSQVFAALANELSYALLVKYATRFYAGVATSLSATQVFFTSQMSVQSDSGSEFARVTRYGSTSP